MSTASRLARVDVRTAVRHEDERLRGRTYAVPFEDVWQVALALASGGMRGWTLTLADDHDGIIDACAHRRFPRAADRVVIRIGLDDDAQTRVDAEAGAWQNTSLSPRRTARNIIRFFHALDGAVQGAAVDRRSASAP
ncbi:MAG: hypothetical protein ACREKM_09990 [Longimicrobiales bacterium]